VIDAFHKLGHRLSQHRVPVLLVAVFLGILGLLGVAAVPYMVANRHYHAAERALEQHDFAAAREHLAQCLQVWNNSAETHFLAARTARRADAYDEAEHHLRECRRCGGDSDAIDLEHALLRAQRGDLSQVQVSLFNAATQANHPDACLILEALSKGFIRTYQLNRARICLDLWLDRQPDDLQALLWRAEVNDRQRNFREALEDYRRVISLDPERDEARLQVGQDLLSLRQPDEALPHFQFLEQRQPENRAVLVGLARCQRLLGQPAEARRLLERVLAAFPDDVDALAEQGRLATEMGQFAEAEPCLRKAVALAPYDRDTTLALAQCLQERGKTDEARQYFKKVEEIRNQLKHLDELTAKIWESPHDPALRHEVGMIFLQSGQTVEGLRWLGSALQEDPTYQPTRLALAEYYAKVHSEAAKR
jgi:tetratricopeptide (TPR) repeat protein